MANQSAVNDIIGPGLCIDPEFPQDVVKEFEQLWSEAKPGNIGDILYSSRQAISASK
jgi:hypothetical protein